MSDGIIIREGITAMDFATVREWLARSYWTPGIEREVIERASRNSALVIGAFADDGAQVGFMRAVSDKVRFAYLCDVIGAASNGLSRATDDGFSRARRILCCAREITIASPEAAPYPFLSDGQSEGKPQANQNRRA